MVIRAHAHVLVLEDQPLIALDMEEFLRQAGFGDVTICASCFDAQQWLMTHKPELAVIETRVRDGSSDHIAGILAGGCIPFIVHTGDTRRNVDPQARPGGPIWVGKPADPEILLRALQSCFPA